MKTLFLPVVAVLCAGLILPDKAPAQTLTKNTNYSRKLRSVLVGGSGNLITSNSTASFIGGGLVNSITVTNFLAAGVPYAAVATIGGGQGNKIEANTAPQLTGGDYQLGGNYSTIGGGWNNRIFGVCTWSTIGGGWNNEASSRKTTISGGAFNVVEGDGGTIAGGERNSISIDGQRAAVGGGQENVANAQQATVGGGWMNAATGYISTIAGGRENTASGEFSTVPGGVNCFATNNGAFVWSGYFDWNGSGAHTTTVSTNDFSFTVRAPGGARFLSTTSTDALVGVILTNGATSWASLSDSNSKTDFQPVKAREILSKLAALPVTSWHYKHDPKRLYIGPMAQDFRTAFGLGSDDKSISTLDSDGVMYAAIQGLVEELKERDAKIGELKAKMEAMEERLNSLPPAR